MHICIIYTYICIDMSQTTNKFYTKEQTNLLIRILQHILDSILMQGKRLYLMVKITVLIDFYAKILFETVLK